MKKSVLIVDESKAIRLLLRNVFQDAYTTYSVPDASSAIYWLTNGGKPDAIIINPNLPDTEEWELVEYLKTSYLYSAIPLVVLSSLTEEALSAKCKEYNIAFYLKKPFNPLDLKYLLSDVLADRTVRASLKVAV